MRLNIFIIRVGVACASVLDRQLLSYAPIPVGAYSPLAPSATTTLLQVIKSRPDLSHLRAIIDQVSGFTQALNTSTNWKFTFFAPTNAAFQNTGYYFDTYAATPKGKWWLGNLLQHHYVPNTVITSSSFNSSTLRFQTGSFLYANGRSENGAVILNNASIITEADIPVTNGVVHLIDHVLDPSSQVFEKDLPHLKQSFIAGSCSDMTLPYC